MSSPIRLRGAVPPWPTVTLAAVVVLATSAVLQARIDDRPPTSPLRAAPGGDGDSWQDTDGREYRLGLVNAPEHDECFGPQATAERTRLTAGGFRADVYATDRYGRGVSVVTLPDGLVLNLHLAREGFADGRYLDDFRAERPELAADLQAAIAEARTARRGLWGACPG